MRTKKTIAFTLTLFIMIFTAASITGQSNSINNDKRKNLKQGEKKMKRR